MAEPEPVQPPYSVKIFFEGKYIDLSQDLDPVIFTEGTTFRTLYDVVQQFLLHLHPDKPEKIFFKCNDEYIALEQADTVIKKGDSIEVLLLPYKVVMKLEGNDVNIGNFLEPNMTEEDTTYSNLYSAIAKLFTERGLDANRIISFTVKNGGMRRIVSFNSDDEIQKNDIITVNLNPDDALTKAVKTNAFSETVSRVQNQTQHKDWFGTGRKTRMRRKTRKRRKGRKTK